MKVSTVLYLVVAFLTCCEQQISPAWASPIDGSIIASGVLRGGAKNDDSVDNTKPPRRWSRWARGTPKANVADAVATISKSCSKIPTLFEEDDAIYDRYAACLAATEGLRRYRNEQLAKLPSTSLPLSKQSNATNTSASRNSSSRISRKRAQAKILASYARDSTKLLNSLNLLTLDEFNAVGRKLQRDASLKAKVIDQAYLYRMQAAVHADRVPLSLRLDVPPRKPSERGKSSANRALYFEAFCQCMLAIETTRRIQAARLMSNLHLDSLPVVGMHVNGDDSDMLPLMDPEVRAVLQDFASRAQRIVDNHGIAASEFNRLLQKTERDPFFRWRVHRQLKRANASVTLV